jgi:Flp pilus assembly protein TadG
MFFRAGAQSATSHLLKQARRLFRDRRGVAAVEFAFIAPLLLSMYFVTMEVAQGIEANKKVGRIGSMVADLITQQSKVTVDELKAITQVSMSVLQPYNRSQPIITITAIKLSKDEKPIATVEWSLKRDDQTYTKPYAKSTPVSLPPELLLPDTFLIRVESGLGYKPIITWSAADKPALGLIAAFDGITMGETYYLRPRMSKDIPCETCAKMK